jgi:hypothetical protein
VRNNKLPHLQHKSNEMTEIYYIYSHFERREIFADFILQKTSLQCFFLMKRKSRKSTENEKKYIK